MDLSRRFEIDPKYGYFVKPSKTYVIVKRSDDMSKVEETFGRDGVKMTVEGERHIGAVIGSDEYKKAFVAKKVKNWVKDVETLAEIEPLAVLSAYNI